MQDAKAANPVGTSAAGTGTPGEIEVCEGATAVRVHGEVIHLAPREGELLAALARRPGSVVNKATLLQQVWHGEADGHAVEVAVARLRRRLAGVLVIETVPRRGYRIVIGTR